MKEILEDIKNGTFAHVYLLYGEEDYLKIRYRQRLLDAIVPKSDDMNRNTFTGNKNDIRDIIASGETLPFFAERRLIFLKDSGYFKSGGGEMAKYVQSIPEHLYLVFEESEVDKRNALYKSVSKVGRAVEFKTQSSEALANFVLKRLANAGKKIRKTDMEYFLSRVGSDMSNAANEADKLISFLGNRDEVTREDIDAITTAQVENKIFVMVRNVTQKNAQEVMRLYSDLITLKEPPLKILALLSREYEKMIRIRDLHDSRRNAREIAGEVGMPEFAVKNSIRVANQSSMEELVSSFSKCVDTEEKIKTGFIEDGIGVEILLAELMGKL